MFRAQGFGFRVEGGGWGDFGLHFWGLGPGLGGSGAGFAYFRWAAG